MKKRRWQDRLMVILGVVALFILVAYFATLGEKYRLRADLTRVQKRTAVLEKEKQKLLQQIEKQKAIQDQLDQEALALGGAKEGQESKEIIIIQQADEGRYNEAHKIIEELNLRLASLKEENQALKEKEVQLNAEIASLAQENSILKARLNSIPELKKAIRDVKLRMRQMSASIRSKMRTEQVIIGGNKGYLLKDGKATGPAKIKIDVKPAS
jgi:chromosome segregation ATPase